MPTKSLYLFGVGSPYRIDYISRTSGDIGDRSKRRVRIEKPVKISRGILSDRTKNLTLFLLKTFLLKSQLIPIFSRIALRKYPGIRSYLLTVSLGF